MASNNEDPNKPVTGYPSPAGQVATGYPRSAPPIDNSYFYSRPPPPRFFARHYHPCRRNRSSILFRITAAIFSAILLMSLVLFIIWLVLRPRLPEFRLSSAVASPLNTTASKLTLTFDLSFQIKNPNTKLNVVYDRLEASVFYMDDFLLTETGLPPFYQAKGNQTIISARLAAVRANVGNDVVMTIREEQQSGSLSFGVRVLALVRFQCRGWRTRKHLLRVFCYGVKMGYSSSGGPGSLLNPLKECLVEL